MLVLVGIPKHGKAERDPCWAYINPTGRRRAKKGRAAGEEPDTRQFLSWGRLRAPLMSSEVLPTAAPFRKSGRGRVCLARQLSPEGHDVILDAKLDCDFLAQDVALTATTGLAL